MVNVAWIVFIALALVAQVFANSGITGTVLHWHILGDELTLLLELEVLNSTDNSLSKDYDRIIRQMSEIDTTMQTSVQDFQKFETAPTCNKMALSALTYTCTTIKGEDQAKESIDDILDEEKSLFATRLAVCELSDSGDQELIPAECVSFLPTAMRTEKKSWLGYISGEGQRKPDSRYPEYEQATRQDRTRCVTALKKTPQTWSSYSNAKQNAHQWCLAARGEVEKGKLFDMYRAMADNAASQVDIVRLQEEASRKHLEALRFLTTRMHKLAQDNMERNGEFWQAMQDAMDDARVQFQAEIDRRNTVIQAQDERMHAIFEEFRSEMKIAREQHNKEIALAQDRNDEASRERIEYANEIFEQQMLQILYNASGMAQEVATHGSNTLQSLQQIDHQVANVGNTATALEQTLDNATAIMQQLQDQMNNTGNSVAALDAQVLAVLDRISSTVGAFIGLLDRIPTALQCFYYLAAAVFLVLFQVCGGGPVLRLVLASTLKTTSHALLGVSKCLGKATKRSVCAMSHQVDIKGGILLASVVLGFATYLFWMGSPIARSQQGKLSTLECIFLVMAAVFIVSFAIITLSLALGHWMSGKAEDEQEADLTPTRKVAAFRFNDPKSYSNKKCCV